MSSERGLGLAAGFAPAARVAGLVGVAALVGCVAVDTDSRGGDGPRVYAGMGKALSAPSTAAPEQVVSGFLASSRATGGVGPLADELRLAAQRSNARTGLTHVRFDQRVGGLRVVDGYVKATLSERGELVHVIEQLAPLPADELREPSVTPAEALGATLDHLGYEVQTPVEVARDGETVTFDEGTVFHREPTVEHVALQTESGLEEGFLVETWSEEQNLLHHTLLDAEGYVVSVELRTNNDSYNVFVEDPLKGAQAVIAGPGAGSTESPAGWLTGTQSTQTIAGNNARAYLDTDNNNGADSGGTAVTDGNFVAVANLGLEPSDPVNKPVSVQNLFYLNNVIHDALYRHGFDEAAGNFQVDNFGNGGQGNDPVQAEAQDGGGTDNANFATPNDGSSPRMQMYLWNGAGPDAQVSVGAQSFGGKQAGFGPALTTKTGLLALVVDGGGASTSDGCEAIGSGSLSGKLALVDRGSCDFTVKVLNAQKAGAVAVIVANNAGDDTFAMGGTNRRITIPSIMVGQSDGNVLRGLLGQSATLGVLPDPLMIDGSLDADIVFHEYGHGLSWRMIGSMSGPLAGAIGEGASDVLAFLINGDDVVAEYSASDAGGIRRAPYASHTMTYKDVTGASVHDDGEIYAAAMWRLGDLFADGGKTFDDLLALFVGGMDFTPAKPTFEQMRDGMLAHAAGSGDECSIWQAFAERGIGVGSKATVRGSRVTITESFAMPASCP